MLKCKTESQFKKSLFSETFMPIKDTSTLATMEFNSNSKITKMERIDSILQNHPKKTFFDIKNKNRNILE